MPAVIVGCMPGGWGSLLLVVVGLFILVAGMTVFVFGAAHLLRLACRMVAVPLPDIDQAMFVSFVETMLGGIIAMGHVVMPELAPASLPIATTWLASLAGLSALGVTLVVAAGVYVPTLKVGFLKGLQISALRYSLTLSALAVLRLLIVVAHDVT
jgi:hypothetical protein